jgi:predicted porin
MNKKLLAMAVGAAIALPGVSLADGDKPDVFGKINLSLDSVDYDVPNSLESDSWEVKNNKSRLGVRGAYDLDVGGLQAIYHIEYEIQPDDGLDVPVSDADSAATFSTIFVNPVADGSTPVSDQFRQRNIFAGLAGGFGTVKVGYFDTPLKAIEGRVDQFNDTRADMENLMTGQLRARDTLQYSSPRLGDMIVLNLAVNPGEELEDAQPAGADVRDGLADTTAVSAELEMDMIYAAVAMEQDRPATLLDSNSNAGSQYQGLTDITRLVAGFNAEAFEVGLVYQMAEGVDDDADAEDASMMLSGAFKMDRVKLKAQYGVTSADNAEADLNQLSLGADYMLGQQSRLYAYIDNKEIEPDTGDSAEVNTFGLGMSHAF